MIIVSQNRKEITNNMNIDITENYDENFTQRWKIENDYYNLGYYKTEERAKEVLEEIVERIENWENLKVGQPRGLCEFVYKMPED